MSRDLRQGLAAQARRSRQRFLSATEDASATQSELLRQCLAPNADTAFGREHGFADLASFDDFRAAVPIRSYAEISAWVERAASGERAVLTAETPIRFWKTTGTTTVPKKIPVTPSSAARTMESFLALQGTQLTFYPELNERRDTTLVTHISPKAIREHLGPDRIPYCTTTELPVEVRPGREEVVAPWLVGLQQVVEDDAERLYYLLCYAALHDLYAIACLHPSRFQTVAVALERVAERLLEELRTGTILGVPCRAPRPDRAAELAAILRQQGRLRPRDVWPNLRMLTGWSGSYISRYRPTMEEAFCQGFLAMPSISSEVFLTMTVDEDPISQPLNLRGGVFEFVASEDSVTPGARTLQPSELAAGGVYEAVVTTLGGLYRYATADLFRVAGFLNEVPRLEYVGRRSVSDLTGEKLAEEQVSEGVAAVLREAGQADDTLFTLCGLQPAPPQQPGYVLVVEGDRLDKRAIAAQLDGRFRALNSRYELKRSFGDLAPLELQVVVPGTFARYRERRIATGIPAGQLKDKILHPQGAGVLSELLELSAEARV